MNESSCGKAVKSAFSSHHQKENTNKNMMMAIHFMMLIRAVAFHSGGYRTIVALLLAANVLSLATNYASLDAISRVALGLAVAFDALRLGTARFAAARASAELAAFALLLALAATQAAAALPPAGAVAGQCVASLLWLRAKQHADLPRMRRALTFALLAATASCIAGGQDDAALLSLFFPAATRAPLRWAAVAVVAMWRYGDARDGSRSGRAPEGRAQRVAVVVLGDVGRSPRMQYHCVSLDRSGARVWLVGTRGEACVPEVQRAAGITVRHLVADPFSGRCPRALFLVYAPLKVLFQAAQLLGTLLFRIPHPDVVLLQIPPSVPTIGVVALAALIRPSRLVFDWHNFGYTILALSKVRV